MRDGFILPISMVVQAKFRKHSIYKSLLSFANLDCTDFEPLLESCCATVAAPMQASGTHEHQGGEI